MCGWDVEGREKEKGGVRGGGGGVTRSGGGGDEGEGVYPRFGGTKLVYRFVLFCFCFLFVFFCRYLSRFAFPMLTPCFILFFIFFRC